MARKHQSDVKEPKIPSWFWTVCLIWSGLVGLALWLNMAHVRHAILALEQLSGSVPANLKDYEDRILSHHKAEIAAHGGVWLIGLLAFWLGARHIARRQFEREQVEAAACRSEERFRLFFKHQVVPMAITSPDKKWVLVNDQLCSLLGYTREELLNLTWEQVTYPNDIRLDVEKFEQLLAGKIGDYTLEKRFIRKDGGIVFTNLSVSCVRRDNNSIDHVLAVIQDLSERRKSEAALRESESKYRDLVENANSIILRWNSRGEVTFLNEFGQKFFGWSQAELIGRNVIGTIVPDTESTGRDLRPLMDQVCNNPAAFERNLNENMLRDGKRVWIAWTNKTVFDSAGNLLEVLSIGTDITESKRAAEALKESEARYRTLFESNPHPMWVYDMETLEFLEVNDAAVAHYGYTREEFLKMTLVDIRPKEEVPRLLRRISEHIADPVDKAGVWKHRKKDGTIIEIEITSHLLEFRGRRAELVLAHDITELKRAEARYRALFDNAVEGIYQTTPNGTVLEANPALARMLGYASPKELISELRDLAVQGYVNPSDREAFCRDLEAHEIISGVEHELRRKDGSHIWVSENARAIRDGTGRVTHYEGSLQDITERKRAEQEQQRLLAQLVQAQKMEAVGQLAGGVAHDFNNILTAIIMQIGLLKIDPKMDPELLPALTDLESEASRAANLTGQLLMFSRRQVMQRRTLDLNTLVGNLLRMLRRIIGETIDLELKGGSEELWVTADPGMIEQVVVNLVVNARDAMPKGGRLTLATSSLEIGELDAQRNPEASAGRFVCLSVSDTGSGMDGATLKRIFEPFFTTKEPGKGTGLGLATVYGILKQHGGWAEAQSTLGVGSTFKVFLPAQVASQEKIQPPDSDDQGKPPGGSETVLVVEDELAVRSIIVRTLRERGYTVLEASNGPGALELLQKEEDNIDLLLTDVVMPGGMSGLDLAQRLQGKKNLKVMLMSGYNLEVAQHGIPTHSGINYLSKPFTGRTLAQAVRHCLDKK